MILEYLPVKILTRGVHLQAGQHASHSAPVYHTLQGEGTWNLASAAQRHKNHYISHWRHLGAINQTHLTNTVFSDIIPPQIQQTNYNF